MEQETNTRFTEEKRKQKKYEVPIWERTLLTIDEAAAYFNIGTHTIREITDKPDCKSVLWVGNKRMIKRKPFEEYLMKQYSI